MIFAKYNNWSNYWAFHLGFFPVIAIVNEKYNGYNIRLYLKGDAEHQIGHVKSIVHERIAAIMSQMPEVSVKELMTGLKQLQSALEKANDRDNQIE